MKATGIIRRMDDLGRVVIPKEIRRTLRIREGEALEIYTDIVNGNPCVCFCKYEKESPLSTHHKEQYVEEKYRLYEVIPRLLLDYKYAILREQINDVMMQLRNPEVQKNAEQSRHYMQQYMQLMSMERQFAELLGERVVIKAKL